MKYVQLYKASTSQYILLQCNVDHWVVLYDSVLRQLKHDVALETENNI